jgi:hypothetical protein
VSDGNTGESGQALKDRTHVRPAFSSSDIDFRHSEHGLDDAADLFYMLP